MPRHQRRLDVSLGHRARQISGRSLVFVLVLLPSLISPCRLLAQDELEVASVLLASPGETLQIPIYGRDVSGTALDGDAGPGRTIQSLAISLDITPAEAVAAVTIERAGATTLATPMFSTNRNDGTVRSAIVVFDEDLDPLVLTLDAPSPGDLLAMLELQLAPAFDQGIVELVFVGSTTGLGATGGTLLETTENGQLALENARITVDSTGLFADGFESGDVSRWSSVSP